MKSNKQRYESMSYGNLALLIMQQVHLRDLLTMQEVIANKSPDIACCNCGCKDHLEYGPDPYNSEILGDATEVWECTDCRELSAREI